MIQQSYEKKLEYQMRMRDKQIAKIQSPEYKERQKEKAKEANEKRIEKARNKPPAAQKPRSTLKTNKPFKSNISLKDTQPLKTSKRIKSKGMAGKARTKSEYDLHDKMAALGCIACINQNLIQAFSGTPVSIHHIDGRTSKNAHLRTLPLCGFHHDVPMNKHEAEKYPNVFPIHAKGIEGGKSRWEEVNGTQYELLSQLMKMIGVES